ncbi:hypothetical protein [Actinomadura alba]|uniref:Uncharacterized protein n=1 Tax=Actinomadura alba TaxID=406431 RepID=A0ABR7LX56_9ACTN|nr:hypothetical protein [Actinomadura alba]MBC6469346.1 hypothetical protein [Actinomadura alba]
MDETHADARAHLERLGAELADHGWTAEVGEDGSRSVLSVCNPNIADLNEVIVCSGETFRWTWGQGIGPATEVTGVATRIMYVLREVAE